MVTLQLTERSMRDGRSFGERAKEAGVKTRRTRRGGSESNERVCKQGSKQGSKQGTQSKKEC